MKSKLLVSILTTAMVCCVVLFSISCGSGGDSNSDASDIPDSTVQMVKAVCSGCHDFIPPETLDKRTWKELVIPVMATKLGIKSFDGVDFRTESTDPDVPKGLYPDKPVITNSQLRDIFRYFEAMAPDQLPLQDRKVQIGKTTGRFRALFPNLPPTGPSLTTYIAIRPEQKRIVLGVGGQHNRVGYFNHKLEPQWVVAMPSAPAYVDYGNPNKWLITCMGSVMPSNKKEGKLVEMSVPLNGQPGRPVELLQNLPRPVQINRMDLDGNGAPDVLINGFGHLWGQLYWLQGGNAKNEKVLREVPGAIRSVFADWDGDGKTDILTLFAQNKESIMLYRNKGNGEYEEKELMKFLPVNGSSFFDVRDVNADGKPDIIYTSGDNADYSVTLKNFHGVYIYLNDGTGKLVQKYFYPIHGCFRVMMRDFDLDGDQDMVTISFFADFISQWNEALVYFENNGNLDFTPFSIEGFDRGRWITMDAGDVDGDGDEDIVTGNFGLGPESFLPEGQPQKFAAGPVFMLLENTTK